jgi:hypothetical protein
MMANLEVAIRENARRHPTAVPTTFEAAHRACLEQLRAEGRLPETDIAAALQRALDGQGPPPLVDAVQAFMRALRGEVE